MSFYTDGEGAFADGQSSHYRRTDRRVPSGGALSPGSAVALELKDKEQALLDQALASGTVKRTSDGRLFLDERAIADRKEGQGFMALLIILVVASIIASVAALAARAGG